MRQPKVSVVIPTYNSCQTIQECIKSILCQSIKPWEVIVVDNGSTDQTPKLLTKIKDIKIITLPHNTGVTGGRNVGIRNSSSDKDYLLFFDHDMVADKQMLKYLLQVAQSERQIGIVTPKIYYFDDRKLIWAAGTAMNTLTGQVIFRGGKDVGQYEQIEPVQVAPASFLVKAAVMKKVKEFDDIYFATYEDTDFCFRTAQSGYKIFYTPYAIAYHKLSPLAYDDALKLMSRAYLVGRNRVIFMRKFATHFSLFLLFLPAYIFYYLLLALKTHKIGGWLRFLQGTLVGFFIS